jgi:hypothetical protein
LRTKPDMSDVLSEPTVPPPLCHDLKYSWVWCRFGKHWFKSRGASRRSNACRDHDNSFQLEVSRRKVRLARQMEETEGSGKHGKFSRSDYEWQVFHALKMNSTVPWPDAPAEGRGRSSLNLPGADDELICGCVPGWPHGPKCYDGLTGAPCMR